VVSVRPAGGVGVERGDPRGGSGAMFDRIAHRYDLLNRVLSLGIDQRWRRGTVRALGLNGRAPGARVLDLATGTADLAILVARRHPGALVDGLDPSRRMLERGRTKIGDAGLADRVRLVTGDAEALPFPDATFDGVTIAFGIRNVPDRAQGLREMRRVAKPGGRVAVLELSEPGGGLLGRVARFHVHTLVPRIGALLSGEREYRYLQDSIAAFPPAEEFAGMMGDAGLDMVDIVPLTLGVCHLYVAKRPFAAGGAAAS
jgi:demethylmenaquinone methyltransferase / 2-methoxy-6-polyprenyl-1,4-benzoquinol methylase